MDIEKQLKLVVASAKKLGFKVLSKSKYLSSHGSDLWLIDSNKRPISVEIKRVQVKKCDGSFEIDPVSRNRRNDDLVAIIFPTEYVLIEPMKDHLKNCNKSGRRSITKLRA